MSIQDRVFLFLGTDAPFLLPKVMEMVNQRTSPEAHILLGAGKQLAFEKEARGQQVMLADSGDVNLWPSGQYIMAQQLYGGLIGLT
jgi:hypothetical protein